MAELIGDRCVGWKVGAAVRAVQILEGHDGPITGRLLATRMFPSPAEVPAALFDGYKIECEFAFRFREAVPARARAYTRAELEPLLVLHLGLELAASRFAPAAGERKFTTRDAIADNGTGGMGILTVRDAREIDNLSAKTKAHMAVTQSGQAVHEVIIQEGVLTNERINSAVAEPVVYMMDRYVVGGFYRVHADRGVDENLNAPGSSYVPLAFEQSAQLPQPGVKPGASVPNRFYMYGVIGRLAMLAASYELEATDPDAEVYE